MQSNVPIKGKLIPVEIEVSTETEAVNGVDYHLVKHTGSGYRFLADSSAVSAIASTGDLSSQMDNLEDSLSSDWEGEEA